VNSRSDHLDSGEAATECDARRPVVWIAALPTSLQTPYPLWIEFIIYGTFGYAALILLSARLGNTWAAQQQSFAISFGLAAFVVVAWRIGCWCVLRASRAASRLALQSNRLSVKADHIRHSLIASSGFGRVNPLGWPDRRGSDFLPRLESGGLACNYTVAESSLRQSLEALPIISDMLEPERVHSRVPVGRFEAISLTLMVVPIVVFGRQALAGQARFLPMVVLTVGMVLFGASRFCDLRLGESLAPVAGPGVVTDRNGRRWTVACSAMLIRPVPNGNGLSVELLGPQGYLLMRFRRGVDDEGFQALWQRWMHPHPRLDLA